MKKLFFAFVVLIFVSCEKPEFESIHDFTTINDFAYVTGNDTIVVDGDIKLNQLKTKVEKEFQSRRYQSISRYILPAIT